MARKVINCEPANEIELVFENGKSMLLRFNMQALAELQKLEGGWKELFSMPVPEICAEVVYAASVNNTGDMTLEKARELVSNMNIETMSAVLNEFTVSVGAQNKEVQEELAKKTMAQFLMSLT